MGERVKTDWEKYCTKTNAQKARKDVEAIINELHKVGKFKPEYPYFTGVQLNSATYSNE